MDITLLPIRQKLSDNLEFLGHPECVDTVEMSVTFYLSIGYVPPWIGYFVSLNGELVGSAGFKGKPVNGTVEIAYGTFESFRKQGIGGAICRALTQLALTTDPGVRVTARTLPEENYSSRILGKNGFTLLGNVIDKDDGEVWEWEFRGT